MHYFFFLWILFWFDVPHNIMTFGFLDAKQTIDFVGPYFQAAQITFQVIIARQRGIVHISCISLD